MELFKKKADAKSNTQTTIMPETNTDMPQTVANDLQPAELSDSTTNEMLKVTQNVTKIQEQNAIQAMFSGRKNERALAENDVRISNVIKSILNWLVVITTAENIRREEYDDLTNRMIRFDEDINEQLELQIKFKDAFCVIQSRYSKQKKLEKQVTLLKILCLISALLGITGIILAIFL